MSPSIELRRYSTADGRVPFSEWIADLDDSTAKRVLLYIDRMELGHFGNSRSVGNGVLELKMNFGPGYRLYYIRDGHMVVVLLCGGLKRTQQADIGKAHAYANDYWGQR